MSIYAYPLTTRDGKSYANPAIAKKAVVGFGDPNKLKAHPRQPFGAFFMPEIQVMAVCVGNSSELPGSFSLGSPTPRASSPDFGESRGDVYSTLLKETTMSNNTQVASATLSILDTNIRCIDGLYSLNDLHKAAGGESKYQPSFFLRNEQTQALIAEIEQENSHSANLQTAIKTINGGHNRGTYACKEIVVAYGAWINPTVHLAVIRAFLDVQAQTQNILPPNDSRDFLRETVLNGKTWYRLSDVAYAYFNIDPSTLAMSIRRNLGDDHCRNLRIHSPRYGWQHCLYATREGLLHCVDKVKGRERTQALAKYLQNQPSPRGEEGFEYTPSGTISAAGETCMTNPTATPTKSIPDCRMMLVLKDGKVDATQILPSDAFACNVEGLLSLINGEFLANEDLINISHHAQSRLNARLTAAQKRGEK